MEHKHIRKSDRFTLSSNYPWLLAQNQKGEHIFYTVHDPISRYRCRIPELVGKRIRGCFHGWMILSNHPHNIEWFLWNPITSNFITLPPLILQDGNMDDIRYCCLSSPPDDPGSVLLLMRYDEANIVFCKLDRKTKRLKWIEISYSEQLNTITDDPYSVLYEPTYCNGKVYAWTDLTSTPCVVQINIAVNKNQVVISLSRFVDLPYPDSNGFSSSISLKGSSAGLFIIVVGLTKEKPVDVILYKLDMSRMVWVEMVDLKDTVIFEDMSGKDSVYSSPAIVSKLSGYIHFLHETGKVTYSYNFKDKTISMSSLRCLDSPPRSATSSSMTVWGLPEFEFRFEGDNEEAKCKTDLKQAEGNGDEIMVVRSDTAKNDNGDKIVQTSAARLLNIPVDVLQKIMEFCVGIEYLNFRATCKLCRLAAPMIQWSKERMRLQTYSLVSPWLMTLDKDGGIMTFTDPMFGDDKYFIKASPKLFYDGTILCSRYGWLLLFIEHDFSLAFFNPFTTDIRKLPRGPDHTQLTFCFSAPPTSPDCIVVGFLPEGPAHVYIHLVAGEPFWRRIRLDFGGGDPYSFFGFPTFCGRDVYTLFNDGGLQVFREIDDLEYFSWETVVHENDVPRSSSREYFLVQCDQHHLLVIVGEFGESVEVFKLNDYTDEWEKIDDLGRHAIYICDTSCVCMDAKIPEMENKIYFPRLNCENGRIVFYSMETRMYHTFNSRNIEQNNARDLSGTKQRIVFTQAWIEPTWC